MAIVDELCPFCREVVEDVNHALFVCLEITSIWEQQLPEFSLNASVRDIKETIRIIQEQRTKEEVEKLFIIAWSMWNL